MSSNPSRTVSSLTAPSGTAAEFPGLESQPLTSSADDPSAAPIARMIPRTETVHGETRVDYYFWLRNRDDPEVIAYLQAENRYTAAVMRRTEGLQQRLYEEMRSRIRETDLSVPEQLDSFLYYTRTEAGGQYPIFCRMPVEGGPEQL